VLVLGGCLAKKDHEFVPLHELLSNAEAEKVLKSLNAKAENLPKILESDPQAKKLGAKVGAIVKISREDAGNEYEYYRLVIRSPE
jgi:DNA-directed RNA polymerase subunit H